MPSCVCGMKVDRLEKGEKLVCINCKQIFHAECCGVGLAEIDFIKNVYKCETCRRRNSASVQLPSTDFPTSDNLSDNSEMALSNPSNQSAGVTNADNSVSLDPNGIIDLSFNSQSAHVMPNSTQEDVLILLVNELKSLRKSNEELHAKMDVLNTKVDDLSNNNLMLTKKLNEMDKLLVSAVSSKKVTPFVAESSPKRKKSGSSKAAHTGVPLAFSPAASIRPSAPAMPPGAAMCVDPSVNAQSQLFSYASVAGSSMADANTWSVVNTKKSSSSQKNKPTVVGIGTKNADLGVIGKRKWLHLSSFKPDISTENIITFVSENFSIEKSHLICYKLIKKEADLTLLKSVNFKLGVSECFAEKLFDEKVWPENVKVRDFIFLEKKAVTPPTS